MYFNNLLIVLLHFLPSFSPSACLLSPSFPIRSKYSLSYIRLLLKENWQIMCDLRLNFHHESQHNLCMFPLCITIFVMTCYVFLNCSKNFIVSCFIRNFHCVLTVNTISNRLHVLCFAILYHQIMDDFLISCTTM